MSKQRKKHHDVVIRGIYYKVSRKFANKEFKIKHLPRWRALTIVSWQPASLIFSANRSGIQKTS